MFITHHPTESIQFMLIELDIFHTHKALSLILTMARFCSLFITIKQIQLNCDRFTMHSPEQQICNVYRTHSTGSEWLLFITEKQSIMFEINRN